MANKTRLGRSVKEYREVFTSCEVTRHMPPADLWEARKLGSYSHLELHHIFGGSGRKDEWTNCLMIRPEVHRNWGHDAHPNELLIVSLYTKFIKSIDVASPLNPYPEREFDIDVLNRLSGRRVLGILENYSQCFDEESEYYQMCKFITEAQDH